MHAYYGKVLNTIALSFVLFACTPLDSHKDTVEITAENSPVDTSLLNFAQSNCASWQAIKLTSKERVFLFEFLGRNSYSLATPQDFQIYKSQPTIIYIKTLDHDFINNRIVEHNMDDKVDVLSYHFSKHKFANKKMSYSRIGIVQENFDSEIYRDISESIKKIRIKNLSNLIEDENAQKILKYDMLGVHELTYLIGDTTLVDSYDSDSQRQLTINDLANSLLMVIYGRDYWNDLTFPAPIESLINLKYEQLFGPPEWEGLNAQQKRRALIDQEYLKFIRRSWLETVLNNSSNNQIRIDMYGFQTPEWIRSVLIKYPDDTKAYTYNSNSNQPLKHQPEIIKSVKIKLESALARAEQVLNDCGAG